MKNLSRLSLFAFLIFLVFLIFISGCDTLNQDGGQSDEPASLSLGIIYTGSVSSNTPIMAEIIKAGESIPLTTKRVTNNGETVRFENLTPGGYFVSLWADQNNDGDFDSGEPKAYYQSQGPDYSTISSSNASEINLAAGQKETLPAISFGP